MAGESQVDLWRGNFGDAYHRRNKLHIEIKRREILWLNIVQYLPRRQLKILEVGAGCGPNLSAIRRLYSRLNITHKLHALEPNAAARRELEWDGFHVSDGEADALPYADGEFDLVFTYGVLIHQENPFPAMQEIHRVSNNYIACIEYFSQTKHPIAYRIDEQTEQPVYLNKDDFGSLYMDTFNLECLGYGFAWKRLTGLDDVTWWLFQKPSDVVPAQELALAQCS